LLDTCFNLKQNPKEHIYITPLFVNVNGKFLKDQIEISADEVSQMLLDGQDLKTSQPSIGDTSVIIEDLLKKYENIYIMCMPSKMAGNYASLRMLSLDYEGKVQVFDQHCMTTIAQWLIEDLKPYLKKQNLTADIMQKLVDHANSSRFAMLIVPDLSFLIKGGRIGKFKGFIAKMLKVKIMVSVDNDGLNFYDKSTSDAGVVGKIKTYLKDHYGSDNSRIKRICIVTNHIYDHKYDFSDMKNLLIKEFGSNLKVDLGSLPAPLIAHTGPNYIAIGLEIEN